MRSDTLIIIYLSTGREGEREGEKERERDYKEAARLWRRGVTLGFSERNIHSRGRSSSFSGTGETQTLTRGESINWHQSINEQKQKPSQPNIIRVCKKANESQVFSLNIT